MHACMHQAPAEPRGGGCMAIRALWLATDATVALYTYQQL